jgi:hypothetical protein
MLGIQFINAMLKVNLLWRWGNRFIVKAGSIEAQQIRLNDNSMLWTIPF